MFRQLVFVGLVLVLLISGVSAYLPGYGYYQDVTLNNTGSDLTNYQMMFMVNTSSGTSSGSTIYLNSHSEADLDDLRFTSTGDTVYDYWIENVSSPYGVWVEVPSIPTGNSTMRVQYGNAVASAYSNATNTWVFFDHFTSLDTVNKWTATGDGCSVASSILTVHSGSSAYDLLTSKATYGVNTKLVALAKSTHFLGSSGRYEWLGYGTPYDAYSIAVLFSHSVGTGKMYYNKNAGGSSVSNVLGYTANQYTVFQIKRLSDRSKYYTNYANEVVITTSYYTGNLPIRFVTYYSGFNVYCDWVAIGNQSDTEPTSVSWIEESETPTSPTAVFSANVTSGAYPLNVLFTDASTNTPTSWEWSFDDGGANSTSQNPTRTFTSTGTYTITLTATNDDGSGTEEKVDYITVNDPPVTTFPGCAGPPTNLDVDGYYEDVNGNARLDWSDLIVFFTYLEWAKTNEPASLFNFANDGGTLTYADVIALFQEL